MNLLLRGIKIERKVDEKSCWETLSGNLQLWVVDKHMVVMCWNTQTKCVMGRPGTKRKTLRVIYGNFHVEAFASRLSLELSLGDFSLGTLAWKLSLRSFRFETLAWELSLWNFRLKPLAWDLRLGGTSFWGGGNRRRNRLAGTRGVGLAGAVWLGKPS